MSGDRLEVNVTFDTAKGYIASAPELRQPIVALSLGGLRRRIEIALLPDDVEVRVHDSTADIRYLVLPLRPQGTEHLSAMELEKLVTRDSMIGVMDALPAVPK